MADKVVMPKLGATMEKGTIDQWLVDEGDEVKEGDPIVEVQTDKISIEVEAEVSGVLLKKLYDVGDTIPVLKTIAYIGEEGEEIEHVEEEVAKEIDDTNEEKLSGSQINETVEAETEVQKNRRTPIARRLAMENDIDLKEIKGTGPRGRIQKVDIERYIEQMKQRITPLAKKIAEHKDVDLTTIFGSGAHGKIVKKVIIQATQDIASRDADVERIPFKGVRKIIAERISDSFYSAPHVTLFSEFDMTEVVTLRKQLLPVIEKQANVRVSYNDILIKASAICLMNHPNINISLVGEKEIVYHKNIHIGFAVAVPNGLVVPALRHADKRGLASITKEAKQLAEQARNGTLLPDHTEGSTFTISNLGMYAVDGFTPIIHQPNAAILGVGCIVEKPVVIEGEVKVRPMMTLSLSFDHRTIDGAPAAEFLTDLKEILENPYRLLV